MKNFYPKQYNLDKKLNIKHNYLSEQFSDYKKILKEIGEVVEIMILLLVQKLMNLKKRFQKNFKINILYLLEVAQMH